MNRLGLLWRRIQDNRLQVTLILSFSLIAAITIMAGTWMTTRVIGNYLTLEEVARVRRGMILGQAVYQDALDALQAAAWRVAAHAAPNGPSDPTALLALDASYLMPQSNRFVVLVDAAGDMVACSVVAHGADNCQDSNWAELGVVAQTLAGEHVGATTEVLPRAYLKALGLEQQATLDIRSTPKAAPELFDLREEQAGLVLLAAAPVYGSDGRIQGAVLAGHLLNNAFFLVDRIKAIGLLDTVTVFFGDLRVSTNVMTVDGERAIGTRMSAPVSEVVLAQGAVFEERAFVVNEWYITRYEPLYNHAGQVVGSLYVGMREAGFLGLVSAFNERVFFIAAGTILLAFVIAIPVARSIVRPLARVIDASHRVAQGDMAARVPVRGRGELATLGRSFNEMVATLRTTREELLRKEKLAAVGQLAAGVAHEINNPLGTILLYADTMRQELAADDPRVADFKAIIDETNRCKRIVGDLLNFARQRQLMVRPTDLNDLARQTMAQPSLQPRLAEVKVTLDLDPGLGVIQADEAQIHQVLINLVDNAIDAMEGRGRLWVRTRQLPGGMVELVVQDTGTGIDPDSVAEIFTPFYTTKPIGKGTGLGLSIVYGIIKMHQGQIQVDSQPGQGATFTVVLPAQPPARGSGEIGLL